jgi:hypothetical protein
MAGLRCDSGAVWAAEEVKSAQVTLFFAEGVEVKK